MLIQIWYRDKGSRLEEERGKEGGYGLGQYGSKLGI